MPPSPAVIHTRRSKGNVWPPKQSSVRELPKTGFSPTIVREAHQGKRFVWPPPKPDFYGNSQGSEIHSVSGDIHWNPTSPVLVHRPPPFAPRSPGPARRNTDDIWPPRTHQVQHTTQQAPRPVKRVGRFDNYIKHTASVSVPATYRAPPDTQNVTYVEEEVVEEEEVEEEEVEEEEEED